MVLNAFLEQLVVEFWLLAMMNLFYRLLCLLHETISISAYDPSIGSTMSSAIAVVCRTKNYVHGNQNIYGDVNFNSWVNSDKTATPGIRGQGEGFRELTMNSRHCGREDLLIVWEPHFIVPFPRDPSFVNRPTIWMDIEKLYAGPVRHIALWE